MNIFSALLAGSVLLSSVAYADINCLVRSSGDLEMDQNVEAILTTKGYSVAKTQEDENEALFTLQNRLSEEEYFANWYNCNYGVVELVLVKNEGLKVREVSRTRGSESGVLNLCQRMLPSEKMARAAKQLKSCSKVSMVEGIEIDTKTDGLFTDFRSYNAWDLSTGIAPIHFPDYFNKKE
jgi:hypothetical protein